MSWLLDDSAGEGTVEGIRTSSANAEAASPLRLPVGTAMNSLAAAHSALARLKSGASTTLADDDAELVALIDNELDEASRSRVLARIAVDEALRAL